MGMYASARGWVEIDFSQRSSAEEVIERYQEGHYSGGWAFPAKPFNWTLYLFYGGDIREGELPWLRAQVTALAALPPIGEDGDRARGLFLITASAATLSCGKFAMEPWRNCPHHPYRG
jgi:hypothetical protein